MKCLMTVLCATVAVLFSACSKKVDGDQLEQKDDFVYFKGEPFTGIAVGKHHSDGTKWEGTFKDGKPDGLRTLWYLNGQKSHETTYKDGKEISINEWDEEGTPKKPYTRAD
jgi:antitoxin component YwqK of YwqJK toxin-antitoxin module